MLNNILVKGLIAWFNDGKRITALVIAALQLLLPKLQAWGVPVPEGASEAVGAWIATLVLMVLSKADVKIPLPVTPLKP